MQRFVIGCTPRTGSNLLGLSLAQHPDIEYANEWFNPIHGRPSNSASLLKLFPFHRKGNWIEFDRLLEHSQVIYLFRENTEAQLDSWERAAYSGIWSNDQREPEPSTLAINMRKCLRQAESMFSKRSVLQISYEQMVADWDDTIRKVLTVMELKQMQLPQAVSKQVIR